MRVFDNVGLIIFDCDGVVADSEPLATRVMQEGLAARGVDMSLDQVVEKFLGRSPETIARVLKREFDLVFDDVALDTMRQRLFELFRSELQAIAGIEALLESISLPYCLASSSHMERIEIALTATRLMRHFDGRIFNAAMVARGKPAPDLFLHAAEVMGVPAERCIVIEDSPAGIEAARRANMRVIGFVGGSHAQGAAHRAAVAEAGPNVVAETMDEVMLMLGVRAPAATAQAVAVMD